MVGRAPRPRLRLAATVALLALTLQTALPLLHTPQLDMAVAAPPGCGHIVTDGPAGAHSLDVNGAGVLRHDAEQCALCQATQQGKRTVVAPGPTEPGHSAIRPADPVPSVMPAAGPARRTTAPRGPPLHA